MGSTTFDDFDHFLDGKDYDSQDWCDGGEAEDAEELLAQFEAGDWQALKEAWRSRGQLWQGCLATILCPQQGHHAQDILVDMAGCDNPDIAFEAMAVISFYCGVNGDRRGPFYDASIVHDEFRARLSANRAFVESVPEKGEFIGRGYELLQRILRGV